MAERKTFNVKKNDKYIKKKRKLEALLNLVREDESIPSQPKKKSTTFQASFQALKDELKKYQKKKCVDPEFWLNDDGRCAQVNFSLNGEKSNCVSPLFVEDLHHLLLKSVLGNVSPFPLRWCKLVNAQCVAKTVLLEIAGLSQPDIKEMYSKLNEHSEMFSYILEVVSSPFTTEQSILHLTTDFYTQGKENLSSLFPMDQISDIKAEVTSSQNNVSRLHLLLSPIQLAMEHYPLPQCVFEQSKSEGYCFSKPSYTPVHDNSPMFAVDCEMCRTVTGRHEVTRIAIVNEKLETVYHTLVKPKEEIVDYVTRFSGITEKMLRNVTTTLKDVQNDMQRILPSDAILCGQSLNCDLHGLKMIHPYVIDTSVIFNEFGVRQKKTSLKQLARIHLKEKIQDGKHGHNPVEDSIATMKLVQLKLKKSIEYGDAVLSETDADNINGSGIKKDSSISSAVQETQDVSGLVKLNSDLNNNRFFQSLSRFSKKVCLIGSEDSLNDYKPEMITDNISKVTKSKVKKIIKATSDSIENHDLILTHLVSDLENCSVTELSDEIRQMYNNFPPKTSFIILMSGVGKPPEGNFRKNYCMITLKK